MYVAQYSLNDIDNEFHASARPTIPEIHRDHTQGMAWKTMPVPPAANAIAEMAGSPAGVKTPTGASQGASTSSTRPGKKIARRASARKSKTRPAQKIKVCGYVLGNGTPCTNVSTQKGQLTVSQATVLTSQHKVRIAEKHLVPCPYHCTIRGSDRLRTFSRRGHLARHFKETCKELLTEERIELLSHECFKVERHVHSDEVAAELEAAE